MKKEFCFEILSMLKKEEGNVYIYMYNVDCVLFYVINMIWVNILVVVFVRVLYVEVWCFVFIMSFVYVLFINCVFDGNVYGFCG